MRPDTEAALKPMADFNEQIQRRNYSMPDLVPAQPNTIALRPEFSAEEKALIKQQTGASDLTEAEFKVFLHMCQHRNLDPLQKELIPIVFKKADAARRRVSYVTPIEVMLARAEETGQFGGICNKRYLVHRAHEESPRVVPAEELLPSDKLISASADIYRKDTDRPFTGTILFEEYGKDTDTWKAMPSWMGMKTAIVQGLRLAFPRQVGKLYIPEEMEHAPTINITATEIPPEPSKALPKAKGTKAERSIDRTEEGRIKIDEIINGALGIEDPKLVQGAHNILAEMVSPDSPTLWLDLDVDQLIAAYRTSKTPEFLERLRQEGIPYEGRR